MSWDSYMLGLAKATAENSKCLSRKIGAVITRDKRIISTGYNGPPQGMLPCSIHNEAVKAEIAERGISSSLVASICPRQSLGYPSGEGLHLCPATHAEANAIVSAARMGHSVAGSTMWLTCEVPCQRCLGQIINAGIVEVVVTSMRNYDLLSKSILVGASLYIRMNEAV